MGGGECGDKLTGCVVVPTTVDATGNVDVAAVADSVVLRLDVFRSDDSDSYLEPNGDFRLFDILFYTTRGNNTRKQDKRKRVRGE